jgi:glycine reductase
MPIEGNYTPTLLHPNELFDGAVVSGNYRNHMRACTYLEQNNMVAMELYRRHGKELNFVGQVLSRGHYDDQMMKERSGHYAAKLAHLLGAQGAILTIEGTGNSNIDYMATVGGLEKMGICAVPIVHEFGGPQGDDEPLFEHVNEAISIVSGGGIDRLVKIPSMKRVIGGERVHFTDGELAFHDIDPLSSFVASPHYFFCGFRQLQISGFRAVDF